MGATHRAAHRPAHQAQGPGLSIADLGDLSDLGQGTTSSSPTRGPPPTRDVRIVPRGAG